jgi:mannose-6-phosphate isomerase-like protein (cupin superfamily)
VFDSEQIWHVVDGEVAVTVQGNIIDLATGDSLVLPPEVERQITATTAAQLVVCGRGDAIASVPGEAISRGVPAWIR